MHKLLIESSALSAPSRDHLALGSSQVPPAQPDCALVSRRFGASETRRDLATMARRMILRFAGRPIARQFLSRLISLTPAPRMLIDRPPWQKLAVSPPLHSHSTPHCSSGIRLFAWGFCFVWALPLPCSAELRAFFAKFRGLRFAISRLSRRVWFFGGLQWHRLQPVRFSAAPCSPFDHRAFTFVTKLLVGCRPSPLCGAGLPVALPFVTSRIWSCSVTPGH